MPADTPTGPISQLQYLTGRMFAGCDALQTAGSWADADEAWTNGIDFGEREIFLLDGAGSPLPQLDQMPVCVISTNQHHEAIDGGMDCYAASGICAAHVYLANRVESGEWNGQNFFGAILQQLWSQTNALNSPGTQFVGLTVPIKQIEILGPTRTPIHERGIDNENDYWDAVFMLHWEET